MLDHYVRIFSARNGACVCKELRLDESHRGGYTIDVPMLCAVV